jgi:SRP40, C-terminal domain
VPVTRPGIGARSHQSSTQKTSPAKAVTNASPQPPPAVSSAVNGKKVHHSEDKGDPADSKVIKKKRKTDGGSVPTVVADNEAKSNEGSGPDPAKDKTELGKKSNAPFQRIKADKVVFSDERLKNNTFESRVCSSLTPQASFQLCICSRPTQGAGRNDYGEKASADLIVTRGADFKKEKNKKKRGSYRGGNITVCFFGDAPPTRARLLIVRIDD